MKARTVLFIILTLIIGFILGMLTSAQIRMHRLNPVRIYFSEDRFREEIYRAIQPNDQQKAEIDSILDKYATKNSEIQGNFRKELEENMRDFRKDLGTHLNNDQIKKLKELDDRRQDMIRRRNQFHSRDSSGFGMRRHFNPGHRPGYMRGVKDSSGLRDTK